jgi:undecaprenyl diphosphate synthase
MNTQKTKIPKAIGIIMDGNRRWAKEEKISLMDGHKRGYEKIKEVMEWAKEAGIDYVTVYAFSTENWNRAKDEVEYLMNLFRFALADEFESLAKNKIRVRFIGQRDRFAEDIQMLMDKTEKETVEFAGPTLVMALSYGGRTEILTAVNSLLKEGTKKVSEEDFSNTLSTAGIPDPDLIIRTSGEMRLSGFLPWQGVYSELFFVKKNWPAFNREDFFAVLAEFAERERRMGK